MKLSTRGRYATRALLDLALAGGEKPVLLRDIARRQDISVRYLEHLVTPMVAAGLLRSVRGPRGGVNLARPPADIKLAEVVHLLEGSVAPVECVDNPDLCQRAEYCAARDLWAELKEAMDGVLNATTLQDLVERQRAKAQPPANMYYV